MLGLVSFLLRGMCVNRGAMAIQVHASSASFGRANYESIGQRLQGVAREPETVIVKECGRREAHALRRFKSGKHAQDRQASVSSAHGFEQRINCAHALISSGERVDACISI